MNLRKSLLKGALAGGLAVLGAGGAHAEIVDCTVTRQVYVPGVANRDGAYFLPHYEPRPVRSVCERSWVTTGYKDGWIPLGHYSLHEVGDDF